MWGVGVFFGAESDLGSSDFADVLELLELLVGVGWLGVRWVRFTFFWKEIACSSSVLPSKILVHHN